MANPSLSSQPLLLLLLCWEAQREGEKEDGWKATKREEEAEGGCAVAAVATASPISLSATVRYYFSLGVHRKNGKPKKAEKKEEEETRQKTTSFYSLPGYPPLPPPQSAKGKKAAQLIAKKVEGGRRGLALFFERLSRGGKKERGRKKVHI